MSIWPYFNSFKNNNALVLWKIFGALNLTTFKKLFEFLIGNFLSVGKCEVLSATVLCPASIGGRGE